MPRADFYLIDKPRYRENPLRVVCVLARKAFEARQPLLILACDPAQAEAIDQLLWEMEDDAFVPHQIAGDADDDITAVLIVPPGTTTPDRALVLNLRDECAPGQWQRVLEVVPADESSRAGSRERWAAYEARGIELAKHDM